MDSITKELIEKIKKDLKDRDIKEIFWNSRSGEILVIAPIKDVDGIYIYKDNKPIPFVPSEDFKLYKKVAQKENLIYKKGET